MFNIYNDSLISTTGRHGSSISEQRVDELDEACLDFVRAAVVRKGKCNAVDVGGYTGAQSKRMAELGADVLLVDLTNQEEQISKFNKGHKRNPIHFVQQDVETVDWKSPLDCVYSQRMINYLPYRPGFLLLQRLRKAAAPEAQFFISSGGMKTEYAADYPDRDKPVTDRFSVLSPAMAEKHNIKSKVCLYDEGELRDITQRAGLKVLRSWTSTFGNPKLIARAP